MSCLVQLVQVFQSDTGIPGKSVQLVDYKHVVLFGKGSAYGLLEFPYLPTEVAFFVDGGVTWTGSDLPVLEWTTKPTTERIPVFSAGVSTRFNLFGYTVLEIFYAKPFQRPGKGAHFGFQIVPGW